MTDRMPSRSLAVRSRHPRGAPSRDSFAKLSPRQVAKNPVMFVVEVGSVLTTVLLRARSVRGRRPRWRRSGSPAAVACWLWFTVLFANFAEAVAEGRGKAQADSLRRCARRPRARRLRRRVARRDACAAERLRTGDQVVVEAGELIPGDGEVIEGVASVDESAITGESAPVIRESGGDRSAVTGGTKVLSDRIVVRITANPGETFLDRMIAPGRRRRAAEDAERDRAAHPAGRADAGLPVRLRDAGAAGALRRDRAVVDGDRGAAGLPDPDHHRRPAVGHRHRRHGPPDPQERDRHERPRRRGGGRRRRAAARQDRHDHAWATAWRPSSSRSPGVAAGGAGRRRPARQPGRRDARGPLDRRAGQAEVPPARPRGRASWARPSSPSPPRPA